jgi:predicted DNA-binding transcriptional regulator AlpA
MDDLRRFFAQLDGFSLPQILLSKQLFSYGECVLDLYLQSRALGLTPSGPSAKESDFSNKLLTAKQAADLLGVSEDWMYKHSSRLPFTVRLSRKAVRFDRKGLLRYLASHSGIRGA